MRRAIPPSRRCRAPATISRPASDRARRAGVRFRGGPRRARRRAPAPPRPPPRGGGGGGAAQPSVFLRGRRGRVGERRKRGGGGGAPPPPRRIPPVVSVAPATPTSPTWTKGPASRPASCALAHPLE